MAWSPILIDPDRPPAVVAALHAPDERGEEMTDSPTKGAAPSPRNPLALETHDNHHAQQEPHHHDDRNNEAPAPANSMARETPSEAAPRSPTSTIRKKHPAPGVDRPRPLQR